MQAKKNLTAVGLRVAEMVSGNRQPGEEEQTLQTGRAV